MCVCWSTCVHLVSGLLRLLGVLLDLSFRGLVGVAKLSALGRGCAATQVRPAGRMDDSPGHGEHASQRCERTCMNLGTSWQSVCWSLEIRTSLDL